MELRQPLTMEGVQSRRGSGRSWMAVAVGLAIFVPGVTLEIYGRSKDVSPCGVTWIMMGIGGTLAVAGAVRRERWTVKANNSGCCPHCGYDLRATLDRCPECGARKD